MAGAIEVQRASISIDIRPDQAELMRPRESEAESKQMAA
jgi:hypothetical protein